MKNTNRNSRHLEKKTPGPKRRLTLKQEHDASSWYVTQILMHKKFSARVLAKHVEKKTGIKISGWIANELAHNAIEDAMARGVISDISLYRAKASKTPYYREKRIREIQEKKGDELNEKEDELTELKESLGLEF